MSIFDFEVFDRRWQVDTSKLSKAQWASVALSCAEYATHTGVKPSKQVKLAAIALEVLRDEFPELRITDLTTTPAAEQDVEFAERFAAMTPEEQLALLTQVAV